MIYCIILCILTFCNTRLSGDTAHFICFLLILQFVLSLKSNVEYLWKFYKIRLPVNVSPCICHSLRLLEK